MSLLIEILYDDVINSLGSFRYYRLIDTISCDITSLPYVAFSRSEILRSRRKNMKVADDYQ